MIMRDCEIHLSNDLCNVSTDGYLEYEKEVPAISLAVNAVTRSPYKQQGE